MHAVFMMLWEQLDSVLSPISTEDAAVQHNSYLLGVENGRILDMINEIMQCLLFKL